MNNQDLINQILINNSLYYMTEADNAPLTNIDIFIFFVAIGLIVLFAIFTLWYSLKD